MSSIVIFGAPQQAELANFYFKLAGHQVDFHCVDDEYFQDENICGTPIIPTSEMFDKNLCESHQLHVAIGFSKLNKNRQKTYEKMKKKGFSFISYISEQATILSSSIGENCFILENNVIQPFVEIADNVVLWSGNHIGHHSKIHRHVFISSHVVISGNCSVGKNCFIGVNATIIDGVHVGKENIIGANALIKRDTEDSKIFPVSDTAPR